MVSAATLPKQYLRLFFAPVYEQVPDEQALNAPKNWNLEPKGPFIYTPAHKSWIWPPTLESALAIFAALNLRATRADRELD